MKKTVLVFSVLAGAIFYVFFNVQSNLNKSLEENYIASRVQGGVTYQPRGSDEWLALSVGTTLNRGDLIKTDRDGETDLLFVNGHALRIKRNSTVGLMTGKKSDQSVQVTLLDGKVMSLVNQQNASFLKVQTPVLTIGVDNSSFLIEHSEPLGLSSLMVSDGVVDVEITGDESQQIDIGGGSKLENIKISTEKFVELELNDLEWTYVENEVAGIPTEIHVNYLLLDFFTGRLSLNALEANFSGFKAW